MSITHDKPEALVQGGDKYLLLPVALVGLAAVVLALTLVILSLPPWPTTAGEDVARVDTGWKLFVVVTLLVLQMSLLRTRRLDRVAAAAVVAAALAAAAVYIA